MEKFLSIQEASEITGYSITYVRLLIAKGELRAFRRNNRADWKIRESDLATLFKAPLFNEPKKKAKK